jgi:hypothetical protein
VKYLRLIKLRVFLLIVAMAGSFLAGYAGPAEAFPIYGRGEYYGYFKNVRDTWGDSVWHTNGPSEYAIPLSINTADAFINYTKAKLAQGPGTQNGIGAAFIIQTMISDPNNANRDLPPTAAQVADWEARVRYAATQGWISWNQTVSYRLNSYYQGPCSGYGCDQRAGDANPNDDAFYDSGITESSSAIVFRNSSGGIAYMLRHLCANPIGTLGPLTVAPNYTTSGRSTVSDATVIPGQTINFQHFVRNNGPDSTSPTSIWWIAERTSPNPAGTVGGAASSGVYTAGQEKNVFNHSITIPNNTLPNTQFCERVGWDPVNATGTHDGRGTPACATVIADFELTPTVTASATSAQQNDSISFAYQVFNPGPTPSTMTNCKIVGNNHGPGYTPLPQQDVDRNSDAGYTSPATICPTNFLVPGPTTVTTTTSETVDVGNATPGSRICRSLVINPKNESGGFRSSAEACVVIAKTPYVHFQGNDVWAGGGFADVNPACNTSSKITTSAHALKDGSIAGSGVEYGAFALGKITNFGSAGRAIVNPAAATGKMLTFSNVNNTNLGFYGAPQHCINDYIAAYSGTPVTTQPGTIDVNQGSGTYQINGAHSFHGNIPNSSHQIWLVNGDVTIDDNIAYSDSYNSVGEIPSLVIISTGNIFVKANVKQMDGLFVAKNTFNTCSDAPAGNLSTNDCKEQLVINGSVIAGTLTLLRTHGAEGGDDNARKTPAEIFNFNAEMYLRSALNGSSSTTLRTVDEKDLPPRY